MEVNQAMDKLLGEILKVVDIKIAFAKIKKSENKNKNKKTWGTTAPSLLQEKNALQKTKRAE